MVLAAEQGRDREKHEKRPYHDGSFTHWAEKASKQHPYHYTAGVRWTVDGTPEPGQADDESGGDVSGDET